jgi:hypothetical protein
MSMNESVFTDEDLQQEYELAILEGCTPAEAEMKALEAQLAFDNG